MTFEEFDALTKKPRGKTVEEWSSFPLRFDPAADMIEEIADFSVIDDFMSDNDMEDFEAEFPAKFPNYRPIATCDVAVATEKSPDFYFDSYAEFFLAVDVASEARRVLVWTGESEFEELYASFEEFLAALVEWVPEE